MRKSRTPIEVFSLSFLDIISCAFGAVVMLILLAKNGDQGDFNDSQQIADLIQQVIRADSSVEDLKGALAEQQAKLMQAQAIAASNQDKQDALESTLARAQNNVVQLTQQARGLQNVITEQERAAINSGKATSRADEVGGIPVDSDYVIFIIDTSGSMKNMWARVMNTMNEVLNNHPQVKGFQVLSDNGDVLGGNSLGSWRTDSRTQRRIALAQMRSWNGSSNSSPVEGIQTALRAYGKGKKSLALYVLGDDYTGGSYDRTLDNINKLNTRPNNQKIARIHAVAFKPKRVEYASETLKFSTLMTEVARQNNGTFLAM